MSEVKLKTIKGELTQVQELSSDQLDILANVYSGVKLSLNDTGELTELNVDELSLNGITVNGCYGDAKSAVEDKFNATITNTGNTYQRILDSAVKEVLLANAAHASEIGFTLDEIAVIKNVSFGNNANVKSFREFKYFTGITNFVGNVSFRNSSMEEWDVPVNATTLGNYLCYGSSSPLQKIHFQNKEQYNYCQILYGYENTGNRFDVYFGDTLVTKVDNTFNKYALLGYINHSVEEIDTDLTGISLCRYCDNLKIFKANNAISASSYGWFADCPNIERVELKSITSMNFRAFGLRNSGEKVLRLILGEDFQSFGDDMTYAFYNTMYIYLPVSNPPQLVGKGNLPSTSKIFVPDAAINTYKSASVWSGIANLIYPISEWTD